MKQLRAATVSQKRGKFVPDNIVVAELVHTKHGGNCSVHRFRAAHFLTVFVVAPKAATTIYRRNECVWHGIWGAATAARLPPRRCQKSSFAFPFLSLHISHFQAPHTIEIATIALKHTCTRNTMPCPIAHIGDRKSLKCFGV